MPTIASTNIPTPKSWDEFEDITMDAAKVRWNSTNFFRNGRPGQKQNGIDIWGDDDENRHIGVQCKNSVAGISIETVMNEIENSEAFEPPLNLLYIATTAKRDAELQKSVRKVSNQRSSAGKFCVYILFWDDICNDIAKDDGVFFKHYPQFRGKNDDVGNHDKILFNQIINLLSSDGIIGFLDENNMAYSFEWSSFDPLREFVCSWDTPEREFIDPNLNKSRKALWLKSKEYLTLIGTETFPTQNSNWSTVPAEWKYSQPDRHYRVVGDLHRIAGEIVSLHREFVRLGKAQLIGRSE